MKKYLIALPVVLFIILQTGCEEEMDERFKKPEWLKGDNIRTLEENGNYKHFLSLMDKAEYRVSIENQLFTLFAPNDSAFDAYFESLGIDSVGDLTKRQAEELFGLHVLINPRSRDQLIYEYAWGELERPEGEYGSLFVRKQTYSSYPEYTEIARYDPEFAGDTLIIESGRTYLPFFTKEYFEDYYGDPDGSDYLAMYPTSNWSGTQWHDAMVIGEATGTSSGFIYYVDRVVKPAPTIDKYISDHPETFGLFYDIAQRFATYRSAGINEKDERVYSKSYSLRFDIAEDMGPNTGEPAAWLYFFSAMIPNNEVFQEYLDNTIFQTYDHIDSVPQPYWIYLLESHLSQHLQIPSKMAFNFRNSFGDKIDINIDTDIEAGYMCNNGVVYTMNKVIEPNVFTCVPGPIVYNRNYTTFLYLLNNTALLSTLSKVDKEFTLFAPTNEELLESGIREIKDDDGEVIIQIEGSDGIFRDMENEDMIELAQNYYHYGLVDNFEGEGFLEMASGNYIYYNSNRVYSGSNFQAGDFNNITNKFESNKNGNLFYIDNSIKQPWRLARLLLNDPDLSAFTDLLNEAGLIDSLQDEYEDEIYYKRVTFLEETDQWTVFAPDNEAIANAESQGLILHDNDEEKDSLRSFLYYHFVREDCIFDDGKLSGKFPTQLSEISGENLIYQELTINNSENNLQVQDNTGQIVPVLHENANTLARFSVVHKIGTCLKNKD